MATQRDVFFATIGDAHKQGREDIIILTADMGCRSLNEFKNNPNFLINTGPSEQSIIDIAIGLALKGKTPICYGISSFIFTRAWEQIRLLCSMNLPVTIIGNGAALSYDKAGVTHHATEVLGVLRCLPNMTIANISDFSTAQYYANLSLDFETPLAICLDKHNWITNRVPDTRIGWSNWRSGKDEHPVIISTGTITEFIKEHSLLNEYGLLEIYQFPYNETLLQELVGNREIISIEEGYKIGGLGDSLPFKVSKKIGFSDFCEARPREEYWQLLVDRILE